MNIVWNTFWQVKRGNAIDEYEDAFCPEQLAGMSSSGKKFAVADGASETMQSGQWAKILAGSYCRSRSVLTLRGARSMLARAHRRWESWQSAYLRQRENTGRSLRWYEESGLSMGAFATLLGVALRARDRGKGFQLSAVALGDSCLFMVRGQDLVVRFPLESSREFARNPICVSSRPSANQSALGHFRFLPGQHLVPGDRIYLMTDAFAAWFLRLWEHDYQPWIMLDEVCVNDRRSVDEFGALVESLRIRGELKNDDVTLIRIELV
ncbi:MAG: protein phosphatase 2C domain-containing protein [Bacillota bacterium]|jgi:hypothetical protein